MSMFGFGKRTSKTSSRSGSRGGSSQQPQTQPSHGGPVPPIEGFERIEFLDIEQRERFIKLLSIKFEATRFMDIPFMKRLGLHRDMEALFLGTGMPRLYGMMELTYRDLTLEFLSSFSLDSENNRVNFRLLNHNYPMSLNDFGVYFGFIFEERSVPDGFHIETLWTSIADSPFLSSRLQTSKIHDPRLRIWARNSTGTLFGRDNTDKLNTSELTILGSFLNVERITPWKADLPYLVASHFERVASMHNISSIVIGGLVTNLARSIFGFDGTGGGRPESKTVPTYDEDHLVKAQHWVKRVSKTRYLWALKKVNGVAHTLELPCHFLRPMVQNTELTDGRPYHRPSYLIDLEEAAAPPHAHDDPPPRLARQGRTPRPRPASPPTGPIPGQFDTYYGYQAPRPVHTDPFPTPFLIPKVEPDWVPMPTHYTPPPYHAPRFDPESFENKRHAHEQVNRNLLDYNLFEYMEHLGIADPSKPRPTYYAGPGNYPGTIFSEYNVDPTVWGPQYHETYGGAAGQFYPPHWYGRGGPPEHDVRSGGGAGASGSGAGASGSGSGPYRFDAGGDAGAGASGSGYQEGNVYILDSDDE